MNVNILKAPEAFHRGASLWLIPDLNSSTWSRRVDWLLNSQIMRAQLHKTKTSSASSAQDEGLQALMSEPQFHPRLNEVSLRTPLMIASAALVPNTMTVVVPFEDDLDEWAKACQKVADELRAETSRIFLPNGIHAENFVKIFKKLELGEGAFEVLELPAV